MEPPKKLITRILEFAALFFLSCCLLDAAVDILLEIWPVLLAVALVVILAVIIWRIIRHRKDLGQW